MSARPEKQAPPDIFYNETEARKYTTSSRIIEIQAKLTERALELLALPDDGIPKVLLDIGCGSGLSGETLSENGHHWIGFDISPSMLDVALEREVDGDLLLSDIGQLPHFSCWTARWLQLFASPQFLRPKYGTQAVFHLHHIFSYKNQTHQGLFLRPGTVDGAISISAVQWLCNADKSCYDPRMRLKAFFGSLYKCLSRGARAVLQFYPENPAQLEMITSAAMRCGFSGGLVVDYPHSTRAKKYFLCLICGPPSVNTALPKAKGEEGGSETDDNSDDEENSTVGFSERCRPRKKLKVSKRGKGRAWILKKKEQRRIKGYSVPQDTKYTARKRKARF